MNDKTLIETEIRTGEILFRVRTYERDSRAVMSDPLPPFKVTGVQKINHEENSAWTLAEFRHGELAHWEVVQQLVETGELSYKEE